MYILELVCVQSTVLAKHEHSLQAPGLYQRGDGVKLQARLMLRLSFGVH